MLRQASPSPEPPAERPQEINIDDAVAENKNDTTPMNENKDDVNDMRYEKKDVYEHSNYVYIIDPKHSWIPAKVKDRNSSSRNLVHLSVPQYKNEQAIRCDGGRSASQGYKVETIDLDDPANQIKYPNRHLPLQNVNSEGELQVVDDMVDLPFLHEAAILFNLKARHVQSLPYTRTGDIILACNPYQWFHNLYSEEQRSLYSQALVWNGQRNSSTTSSASNATLTSSGSNISDSSQRQPSAPSDPRTMLPPHVYETSCLAFMGLVRDQEDQSILVSGESGAGKTETVKILMHNLASIQEESFVAKPINSKGVTVAKAETKYNHENNDIVQRVLDSNPLLEAFGNATTLRNDNSSRFGKYLQLQYDISSSAGGAGGSFAKHSNVAAGIGSGILAGSKCEVYLLEKSRVTHHHDSERTYHIFYQLLAAPEELKTAIWDGLENTDNESFCYVGETEIDIIEGKTDAERFQLTLQALELIGIRGGILQMLLRALCIVLQLGNIEFTPAQPESATGMSALGIHNQPGYGEIVDDNHDASDISSIEELQELSELIGMNDIDTNTKVSDALRKALTVRNVEARGEVFAVPLTPAKAKESADAFAKEIYAKTFLWLVRTINDATCAEKNFKLVDTKYKMPPTTKFGIIGLLDIFGFETFEVNRFEQLCINYCNEKLQQKFTQDIFRSVQMEYEHEGIELEEITYDDNTDVLDLVEGRMGLLAFLNEECVRPKGCDKTFVYKAQAMNKENRCFLRDKHAADTEFGIHHYAGKVKYDATNFVKKNTDTLPSDLLNCAKLSSNAIIANELNNESMMNPLHKGSLVAGTNVTKKKKRPKSAQNSSNYRPKKRTSNLVADTVWTKFKTQLSRLMETLSHTKTRYIRCIKPNTKKAPLYMEHASTVEQLRCAGVVAAVTISRSAFPNRLEHIAVLDRFKSLWPKGDHMIVLQNETLDIDARCKKATEILLTFGLREMEFEKNGSRFRAFVMGKTRAYFRAGALEFLEAERMKHLGAYAIVIQTSTRRFIFQSMYARYRISVINLQSNYRRILKMRIYLNWRKAATRIECWYRVVFASRRVYHLRRFLRITLIQTRWRIHYNRRRFHKAIHATIILQAMIRGCLQRPKYKRALNEKKEEAKLENQLRSLQKKLEEAELKRLEAEKEAEGRITAAMKEFKERETRKAKEDAASAVAHEELDDFGVKEQHRKPNHELSDTNDQSAQDLTAEQQQLMDESGKMLEHLRKEVFRLRGQNQQLKTDFDLLKDNNQRLMDANASAGASFAALNQHAKQLSKQNGKLVSDVQNYKGQVHKLNILQVEVKEELRLKSATYIAEVQSRLQYQKALQKITDTIQEKCRDHRLVEHVLTVADEVDMDFIPGSHERPFDSDETDGIEEIPNDSRRGILSYFFS